MASAKEVYNQQRYLLKNGFINAIIHFVSVTYTSNCSVSLLTLLITILPASRAVVYITHRPFSSTARSTPLTLPRSTA